MMPVDGANVRDRCFSLRTPLLGTAATDNWEAHALAASVGWRIETGLTNSDGLCRPPGQLSHHRRKSRPSFTRTTLAYGAVSPNSVLHSTLAQSLLPYMEFVWMLVSARSVHDHLVRAGGNCRSLVEGHNQNHRLVSDPRCYLVQRRLRSALALSHYPVLRFCLRCWYEVLLIVLEAATASTAFRGGMHTMAVFFIRRAQGIHNCNQIAPYLSVLTAILEN